MQERLCKLKYLFNIIEQLLCMIYASSLATTISLGHRSLDMIYVYRWPALLFSSFAFEEDDENFDCRIVILKDHEFQIASEHQE